MNSMDTGYFTQQYRKDARWDWVDFYCGVQFGSTVTFDIGGGIALALSVIPPRSASSWATQRRRAV